MTVQPDEKIMGERRQLLNLGYRLLGSLADAEDVVQETYTRWYAMSPAEREAIESPGAWLTKVAGRLCLNLLGSARVRREAYVGEWIPEPLPAAAEWSAGVDPADRITLDESVTMALLVVFESMTPAERVAFVLHDVFRYPFAEVAEIVGRSPAACRQLASSARRRVAGTRATAIPDAARQASVVRRFRAAWQAQDIEALIGLLDPAATAVSDGGGRAVAHPLPIEGAEEIARFYLSIARLGPTRTVLERTVNGRPGLVIEDDGRTETVFAFEVAGDRITHIWAIRNPDKLRPWRRP
ncbi:RNA polymerase sigma factor SigJ [Paractinoplanes durhamensis]|uniref:RNA polymerase sigma24 factor n=1 Tax=Paractinoplanes durhamensis TaxID=113563 RepID=A0ABQ3Z6U1_9ACTN|nr:RNA polymerase sigma factor SigJ [Actinoplanes durhamensis]GIE05550.1 RNA polymerase sigma24 factor [Actinoplanes durhamensis]